MWYCYILMSESKKRTYIGKTNDPHRRLRQHNGEIVGGAKSTLKDRPWNHICIISGFKDEIEALRFEYMMKHFKKSSGLGRFKVLNDILISEKLYQKLDNPQLTIEVKEEYVHLINPLDIISIKILS